MSGAHETIETYLARLDEALRRIHEREREELVAEVRAHLEEAAARAADPEAAVKKAVGSLGDPERLAARLGEGEGETPAPERVKRILGMPYNFRRLTSEQVASRIWNPSDPRILMPRVFGLGWTLNFGAIAVRLGLLRPDDEEPVPFTNVPEPALSAGIAIVTLLTAVTVAIAVIFRDAPRPLPVHWSLVAADRFEPAPVAALMFLAPAVLMNLVALVRAAFGASRTERALWVAVLVFASFTLEGVYLDSLAWAYTGRVVVPAGVDVLAGVLGAFAALVVYSRIGVRAEWRRARIK